MAPLVASFFSRGGVGGTNNGTAELAGAVVNGNDSTSHGSSNPQDGSRRRNIIKDDSNTNQSKMEFVVTQVVKEKSSRVKITKGVGSSSNQQPNTSYTSNTTTTSSSGRTNPNQAAKHVNEESPERPTTSNEKSMLDLLIQKAEGFLTPTISTKSLPQTSEKEGGDQFKVSAPASSSAPLWLSTLMDKLNAVADQTCLRASSSSNCNDSYIAVVQGETNVFSIITNPAKDIRAGKDNSDVLGNDDDATTTDSTASTSVLNDEIEVYPVGSESESLTSLHNTSDVMHPSTPPRPCLRDNYTINDNTTITYTTPLRRKRQRHLHHRNRGASGQNRRTNDPGASQTVDASRNTSICIQQSSTQGKNPWFGASSSKRSEGILVTGRSAITTNPSNLDTSTRRARRGMQTPTPTGDGSVPSAPLPPITVLIVRPEEVYELERNVSELTMRSSYTASIGLLSSTETNTNRDVSALPKVPSENRRMAYYAVGKHYHNQGSSPNSSGNAKSGNRRCYFTGKIILNNVPFYAGCVQQGLRTLVVFCLPSALGLPNPSQLLDLNIGNGGPGSFGGSSRLLGGIGTNQQRIGSSSTASNTSRSFLVGLAKVGTGSTGVTSKRSITTSSVGERTSTSRKSHNSAPNANIGGSPSHYRSTPPLYLDSRSGHGTAYNGRSKTTASVTTMSQQSYGTRSSRRSRFTSNNSTGGGSFQDETTLGLSIASDLDSNWEYDRDTLLAILPQANDELLQQMAKLYPEQFETLPVQVRDATKWKLYIKFCFFSGLPIGASELHYKVRDDIAEKAYYGEEIVLSHEVMVASVSAPSAELLTLPNRTVIRYLRKHYAQQCAKLHDQVFERASWERIAPEV